MLHPVLGHYLLPHPICWALCLSQAASAEPSTKWGVYNGRVQRIDGHPGGPFAELTPSVPNVVVGAPSLIHMITGTAELMGAKAI